MPDFSFIHAADLHIDSPLQGLERYPEAPVAEMRGATRRAFENLVRLAISEKVAFVVLAGDLFDDAWRDWNTGVFFGAQLARLHEAGVAAFIVHGNHDSVSEVVRTLRWPASAFVFSHEKPETKLVERLDVALHGMSFPVRDVRQNLALGYPSPVPGAFNLGVLHTALQGNPPHESYAPCSVGDLTAKGYDYWALGHVHQRAIVSQAPWIVFPGNLQGRSVRETGAKGCALVTVKNGVVTGVREEALDVVRWAVVELEASALPDGHAVTDALVQRIRLASENAGRRVLAVRAVVTGRSAAAGMRADPEKWRAQLVASLAAIGGGTVWLEKYVLELESPRVFTAEDARGLGALEVVLASLAAAPPAQRPEFEEELERKLAAVLPASDPGSPFAPENLQSVRGAAFELVLARLKQGNGGAP